MQVWKREKYEQGKHKTDTRTRKASDNLQFQNDPLACMFARLGEATLKKYTQTKHENTFWLGETFWIQNKSNELQSFFKVNIRILHTSSQSQLAYI